ncbi:expressed unknown protein [Seminavis robusta]|uniref:Uncharacterized protein n=1 Tax=Seminavis robusta TaxID=568900 RepID=A0A9N8DEE1_9STRA|nr:expressed unknown protein [Seminavis robusta]|eukprot:Sro80_g042953.1  (177) ;mRNA; f:21493-22023
MSYRCWRYIHDLVNEFQEPNTSLAKRHYNDVKYTSLMLFNKIVDALRKRQRGDGAGCSWFDTVLEASKIIEETTLMREQMRDDEARYKQDLINWHCSDEGKMMYRIPNKVKTFKQFRKKTCKVKDYAVEIVTKMYRLDQINRKEMNEEVPTQSNFEFEDKPGDAQDAEAVTRVQTW